jgi:lactam utilization protein B
MPIQEEARRSSPRTSRFLNYVTSVDLSCGFHAGNQKVIRDGAVAAIEYRVVIGAQVSFRFRLTGER